MKKCLETAADFAAFDTHTHTHTQARAHAPTHTHTHKHTITRAHERVSNY